MERKIRIAIVADEKLFRDALTISLRNHLDITIVFEASNGRELLDLLKIKQVDLVLLDYEMPVMNGLEALEIIRIRFPELKVIFVSKKTDVTIIAECMAMGASSFHSKFGYLETLVGVIRTVYKDGYYFDNLTSRAMLSGLVKDKTQKRLLNEIDFNEKEKRVMNQLCDGKTTKEISSNLHMATSTVDLYRTKIYSKSNSNNTVQLLKFAVKKGLVTL